MMKFWEKIKSEFTGDRRRFAWFTLVVLIVFIFSWLVGDGNTIPGWIKAKKEIKNQKAQMEEYQRQIDEMDGSIDQRVTDIDTLEKFAREQYNFAAPGEDVYIIEK